MIVPEKSEVSEVSDGEVLIDCRGVSKRYCRHFKRSLFYGLLQLFYEFLPFKQMNTIPLRKGEFWANKDVSFQVKRGECLGIVGRNGSGKTTILKIINGLLKPDRGEIVMKGRVGALIALGAGFNPILTGRENVYINGSILGFKKREIDALMPKIIEFSELGEFLDTPVRNYSSGMKVRLGFAIAINIDPDILIIDEVLAVGDQKFRRKAREEIQELLNRDIAVIFISHNIHEVMGITSKVMWLDKGNVRMLGPSVEVCSAYSREMLGSIDSKESYIHFSKQTGEIQILSSDCTVNGELVGRNIKISQQESSKKVLNCIVKMHSTVDLHEPLYYIFHLKNASNEFVGSIQFKLVPNLKKNTDHSLAFEFELGGLHMGEYVVEMDIKTVAGPLLASVRNLIYIEISEPQYEGDDFPFAQEKMKNNERGSYFLPLRITQLKDRSL